MLEVHFTVTTVCKHTFFSQLMFRLKNIQQKHFRVRISQDKLRIKLNCVYAEQRQKIKHNSPLRGVCNNFIIISAFLGAA